MTERLTSVDRRRGTFATETGDSCDSVGEPRIGYKTGQTTTTIALSGAVEEQIAAIDQTLAADPFASHFSLVGAVDAFQEAWHAKKIGAVSTRPSELLQHGQNGNLGTIVFMASQLVPSLRDAPASSRVDYLTRHGFAVASHRLNPPSARR